MTLSSELLESHMNTFLGYGNPAAPYWFIGMEEGGDCEAAFVSRRLNSWDTRGRATLEDSEEYHRRIDLCACFDPPRTLQLGRPNGETALLELFSLPVSRLSRWPYAELSDLPNLRTRNLYHRSLASKRVQMIKDLVDQHAPEFVVMYGTSYRKYWEQFHEGAFLPDGNFLRGRRGRSELVLIKHPAARGTSNMYFEEVGRRLGDLRNGIKYGAG